MFSRELEGTNEDADSDSDGGALLALHVGPGFLFSDLDYPINQDGEPDASFAFFKSGQHSSDPVACELVAIPPRNDSFLCTPADRCIQSFPYRSIVLIVLTLACPCRAPG